MNLPIHVENLSKIYKLYDDPSGRLKEALFRGRKKFHRKFTALKDISFSVGKGETIGVIGKNGSGKSTLLQIIASIVTPTSGTIEVNGRISALLELGSGFDPEFTGRENVYLNGSILGIKHEEISARFDDIEKFAGIGHFIDQPVKNYSSGMYVRLAFATAVNVDPDILLVDEALAVGDIYFQHRCMAKIRDFQEHGKTIFFVTHDTGAIVKLCTKAILLDKGEMISIGQPDDVVQEYYRIIWNGEEDNCEKDGSVLNENDDKKNQDCSLDNFEKIKHFDNRFGNDKAKVIGFTVTDFEGKKRDTFKVGMKIRLSLHIKCFENIEMPMAGFIIKDLLGNELIKTNSDTDNALKSCRANSTLNVTFVFSIPQLRSGSYSISAGFGEGTIENHIVYDWLDNFTVFTLDSPELSYGMLDIPVKTEVTTYE
ncbi:MAG: ABC transporter ATP-binding protein [Desulfobacula sp.]|uniref:ABC transporter ATP-binding protein n=1 Tax=Desulfobacula sp. TaxID=2593537 RepID=UPI0025C209B9|nr:ABC transporter ATP-binding protein [Desulfobacula sp.]MCD4722713.1 ABC transporter ATP-binding protein [Desulfobacula sp.]